MRRLVLVLLACFWGVPAAAYCEDEAGAARARAWNSGPFHFETTRWSKDFRTRACGEILPDVAESQRSCDAGAGIEHETVWIGDRRWEKDSAGWRGPYSTIRTHQDRMPVPEAPFSANQAICSGRVVIDGRAANKYEFIKQIGDRVWVETIFTDEQSGIPIRFETRGRSDADVGAVTVYRHDASIRIDPPTVDLEKRWSESLQRLSQEAQKGDPACRAEFFAAVQRGRMAAFEFAIEGSFESRFAVAGTFVPSDAINYRFTSLSFGAFGKFGAFGETVAAGGRAWTRKSWSSPEDWLEAPEKLEFAEKIVMSLFPGSEHVGQVRCSGKVSMDGRDFDMYEYDFYRDSESARALDSHRSMLVEKASGIPFRNVSVSRTNARQWEETRRYDPTLTIQTPPREATQRSPSILGPVHEYRPPAASNWPLGRADAYWPPSGPNWPPFILTPHAETNWPPPGPN
jgi:hypothetical protein